MTRTCTYRSTRGQILCTECGKEVHLCTCPDPDDLARHRLEDIEGKLIREIAQRLNLDLTQHRTSKDNLVNLHRDVWGIVSKLAGHRNSDGTTTDEIHQACVHTAVSALMISLNGDMDFSYEPDTVHSPEDK